MVGEGIDKIAADEEQYKTSPEDKDEDDDAVQYPFLERKGEQSMYKSMQKTLKSDKDGDGHSSFPSPEDLLPDPK